VVAKRNGTAHKVPLPRQAVKAIGALQPLTVGGEYVFPGPRDHGKPMSEAAVSATLHATGYKGLHCWHGYRATGRTLFREVFKIDVDVIEAQVTVTRQSRVMVTFPDNVLKLSTMRTRYDTRYVSKP